MSDYPIRQLTANEVRHVSGGADAQQSLTECVNLMNALANMLRTMADMQKAVISNIR